MNTLRNHWKNLKYLTLHKFYVFQACCYLGIPWLGLIHDWSKLLPDEWFPYSAFFGRNQPRDKTGYYKPIDTGDAAFDFAWLLHQKRNRHHWQFWVLPQDEDGLKILRMPSRYLLEMVADWWGAGIAQHSTTCAEWYAKNGHKMQLHPITRVVVEHLLPRIDALKPWGAR